jgi:dihydroorotate dehydrogenase electron transfer subunit
VTVAPRSPQQTPEGRPGDGPLSGRFEVVEHREEGAYRVLTVAAPEVAERCKPGQFIEVGVGGQSTLLRRPFSIASAANGTVTFVYDVHGAGTEWLTGVQLHQHLDVIGPLGVPFPLPNKPVSCLLIAGGYGAAPLFWLAEELQRAGNRVDFVNGAASESRLHAIMESKRVSSSVAFTTDDGSYGVQGRVTDVLEERVEACASDVVYAVGPMGMLRAVAEEAARLGVPCQVSVEENMACGVGVCWTCILPMHEPDGTIKNRRACLDGPVFSGAKVAWEHTRWAVGTSAEPEDAQTTPVRHTDEELFG